MTKYTVTVECAHYSSRRWWLLGDRSDDATFYLHGCDGCASIAERAGLTVTATAEPE